MCDLNTAEADASEDDWGKSELQRNLKCSAELISTLEDLQAEEV
jgi:hypothetical protein